MKFNELTELAQAVAIHEYIENYSPYCDKGEVINIHTKVCDVIYAIMENEITFKENGYMED